MIRTNLKTTHGALYKTACAGAVAALLGVAGSQASAVVLGANGEVDMGNLPDYLFYFGNGSNEVKLEGGQQGPYVGDTAYSQTADTVGQAKQYEGAFYTDAATPGGFQDIVDDTGNNPSATGVFTGETARLSGLAADFERAVNDIYGLTATAGWDNYDADKDLNITGFANGIAETIVVNVTAGFGDMKSFSIEGDSNDLFVLRFDSGTGGFNPANGLNGEVKLSGTTGAGKTNLTGGMGFGNIVSVAGDINASGGGLFAGYWLAFGKDGGAPDAAGVNGFTFGEIGSLPTANIAGGLYTTTDKVSIVSGSQGFTVLGADFTVPQPIPVPASLPLLLGGVIVLRILRGRASAKS